MPELPEVDFARQQLARWLRGRQILEVVAHPGTPLRQTRPRDLAVLCGQRLRRIGRLGKHLFLWFEGDRGVHLHLGMTGKIVRCPRGAPTPRFSKVGFVLSKTEVHFCDSRRFGRFQLLPAADLAALPAGLGLGPDALTALPSARALAERLGRVRRAIKVALLDQSILAGLGNIQAAEALWRARLSPFTLASELRPAQVAALRVGVRESLAHTVKKLAPDLGRSEVVYVEEGGENWFLVYGREGQPCPRDQTPIRRSVQGQRSTFECPTCQR